MTTEARADQKREGPGMTEAKATVDQAHADGALLRRAVGVLTDIARTRREAEAVLDAFAKRQAAPQMISELGDRQAPSAVEAVARLPYVVAASSPELDRMLEAYYRDAIERIAREFDALTPDLVAAAREAGATSFREELRSAERQIAAVGAAWRTAFPESRFSGPNVEVAIPLVGREFQRLRRVAELAVLLLEEEDAAGLQELASELRSAVTALVSEREEERPGESIREASERILAAPHGDRAWRVAREIVLGRGKPWSVMARAARIARRSGLGGAS